MKPRHPLVFVTIALVALSAVAGPPTKPVASSDLEVNRIEFTIARSKGRPASQGTVTVTAVVRNAGTGPFVSRNSQQFVTVSEVPLGGSRETVRRTCYFGGADMAATVTLNPGQEVRCSFSRPWDTAVEFPPGFMGSIVYDPDIALDSNPRNDDRNMRNNTKQEPGSRINDLFAR